MWELTKAFRFEAAHAISGTTLGAAGEEVHGHSFRAEVTIKGAPDPATGMLLDLGLLEQRIAEVQQLLTKGSREPLGLLCVYAVDPCLDPYAPVPTDVVSGTLHSGPLTASASAAP